MTRISSRSLVGLGLGLLVVACTRRAAAATTSPSVESAGAGRPRGLVTTTSVGTTR